MGFRAFFCVGLWIILEASEAFRLDSGAIGRFGVLGRSCGVYGHNFFIIGDSIDDVVPLWIS